MLADASGYFSVVIQIQLLENQPLKGASGNSGLILEGRHFSSLWFSETRAHAHTHTHTHTHIHTHTQRANKHKIGFTIKHAEKHQMPNVELVLLLN